MEVLNNFIDKHNIGISFFLAIAGIFISIYFGRRILKKRIYYLFAQKDNTYILALWNGSKIPIYSEDIFNLYLKGGKSCHCETKYSTDEDVIAKLQETKTHVENAYTGNKWDINFDFLLPHEGFIFNIKNEPNNINEEKILYLNGRIRGEKKNNIKCVNKIKKSPVNRDMQQRILDALESIISISMLSLNFINIHTEKNTNWLFFILITVFIISCYLISNALFLRIMPFKLWKKFKDICNENDSIKSEVCKKHNLFIVR